MTTKTFNNVKEYNSIEDFATLIDKAKMGCVAIYYNGKKMDKRMNIVVDLEDVFDNNVPVKYLFYSRLLFVGFGNYY